MSQQPEIRIADSDRDAAATALGEHYAAGRITREEYDERSATIWAARTNRDLSPVFADLPGPHQSGRGPGRTTKQTATPFAVAPAPRARGCGAQRGGFRFPFLPLVLLAVGLVMLTGIGWPVFALVGVLWWAGAFRWLHRSAGQARGSDRAPRGRWA